MPRYNNRFANPRYKEETIVNDRGMIGTIRVKPSSILWKPKGARQFYSVPLDGFTAWITDKKTRARRTGS